MPSISAVNLPASLICPDILPKRRCLAGHRHGRRLSSRLRQWLSPPIACCENCPQCWHQVWRFKFDVVWTPSAEARFVFCETLAARFSVVVLQGSAKGHGARVFKRGVRQSVTNRPLHVSDTSSRDKVFFALVLLTFGDLTIALTAKTRAQATLLLLDGRPLLGRRSA